MATYHTVLGFCDWDLPAAIILLVVIGIFVYKTHKLKKREKELQDLLDEKVNNSQMVTDAASSAVPLDRF